MDRILFHVTHEELSLLLQKWIDAKKPDCQTLEGYIFEFKPDQAENKLELHPFYKHEADETKDATFVTQLVLEECPTPPGYDDMKEKWEQSDFNC